MLKLVMDKHSLPQPGQRMLHLAPERHLAQLFREILGEGYDPVDIRPERYPWEAVRQFDLTTDVERLVDDSYDIVLHSHVMEHIPCNITAVLFHLHRALKPGGFHIFCIPVLPGTYAEDIGAISKEKATKEFGQFDHVRRFGAEDLPRTLGMVFEWPDGYDIETEFGPEVLDMYNIPQYARKDWHPHNVLVMRKEDLKLKTPEEEVEQLKRRLHAVYASETWRVGAAVLRVPKALRDLFRR